MHRLCSMTEKFPVERSSIVFHWIKLRYTINPVSEIVFNGSMVFGLIRSIVGRIRDHQIALFTDDQTFSELLFTISNSKFEKVSCLESHVFNIRVYCILSGRHCQIYECGLLFK